MQEEKENLDSPTQIESTTESRTEKILREYEELYEKIEENGANSHTYDPEASLIISGKDFANMVNYCVSVENILASMRDFLTRNKSAIEHFEKNIAEMELFNSSMGLSLLKQHNNYFNSGDTITQEQADVIYAKEKVKPLDE